jgi:hypothetical protein
MDGTLSWGKKQCTAAKARNIMPCSYIHLHDMVRAMLLTFIFDNGPMKKRKNYAGSEKHFPH